MIEVISYLKALVPPHRALYSGVYGVTYTSRVGEYNAVPSHSLGKCPLSRDIN